MPVDAETRSWVFPGAESTRGKRLQRAVVGHQDVALNSFATGSFLRRRLHRFGSFHRVVHSSKAFQDGLQLRDVSLYIALPDQSLAKLDELRHALV